MASKQRILIVDDDENIAELISLYLTKECYETKIVYDGESAFARAHRPDHADVYVAVGALGDVPVQVERFVHAKTSLRCACQTICAPPRAECKKGMKFLPVCVILDRRERRGLCHGTAI